MSLLENWLTEDEAAAALRKSKRTLALWRQLRKGPAWTRNGKEILYRRDAIPEYLRANETQPVRERRSA